jgi:hypothetical protein
MSFRAGGQIHIDLNGLRQQTEDRITVEKRLEENRHLDRNSEDLKNLPENYFGEEWDPKTHETIWAHLMDQRKFRPWVGPKVTTRNSRLGGQGSSVARILMPHWGN